MNNNFKTLKVDKRKITWSFHLYINCHKGKFRSANSIV